MRDPKCKRKAFAVRVRCLSGKDEYSPASVSALESSQRVVARSDHPGICRWFAPW